MNNIRSRYYEKGMLKRIKIKLNLLGLKLEPHIFVATKIISSIVIFVLSLTLSKYGYILAPIITIMYYLLFESIILDLNIKRRIKELESDALEYFPIFLISLKSGRNIRKSIKTTNKIIKNSISEEFIKVERNISIGKSFDEALELFKDRCPSNIVTNMIVSIREANKHGNNLNDTINIQLSYLEDKQKQLQLKKYSNIPLKIVTLCMSFIIIFIVVSIIFKVIL